MDQGGSLEALLEQGNWVRGSTFLYFNFNCVKLSCMKCMGACLCTVFWIAVAFLDFFQKSPGNTEGLPGDLSLINLVSRFLLRIAWRPFITARRRERVCPVLSISWIFEIVGTRWGFLYS